MSGILKALVAGVFVLVGWQPTALFAAEYTLAGKQFTVPDGMVIEQVAGPPLVDRPICGDFDEQGRLYVADSSGSNENVQTQLEKRPHRIVRLEDTDGDGQFDKSEVFADQMMFPEGTLWYDGSLYVGAPPQIWKLSDTDDDGQADKREVWYDGKTLTGCANDLHGPYLGRDGWIYWCKGAFAEQVIDRPGRKPLRTRAAHIFRRHPDGGPVESVMTGGMDNPVEVVFTPGGERIFTTTFLVRPAYGLRDGLIHAIYGGVYGKVHGVLDGHVRTGPIMPVLVHHGGASAPCGLAHLESDELGDDFQHNLLACSFNLHKVFRHMLIPNGGSYSTVDSDFLVCDDLDFHPTDILEDADGSLLVIDTGGWYKLCCPTSQLVKPDVLGAIYRIRREGGHNVPDAGGREMEWSNASTLALITRLDDERFQVRRRAGQTLADRGASVVAPLRIALEDSNSARQRLAVVWTLTQIEAASARAAVRQAVDDPDATVRQAAMHSISVHRDREAESRLVEMLQNGSDANRRVAAEALGRIGSPASAAALLAATAGVSDRILQHSLTYAVIEIGDVAAARAAFAASSDPHVVSNAAIALDQLGAGELRGEDLRRLLTAEAAILRETGWWIVDHRPHLAGVLEDYFRERLAAPMASKEAADTLSLRLGRAIGNEAIQQLVAERLADRHIDPASLAIVLEAVRSHPPQELPPSWIAAIGGLLSDGKRELLPEVVATALVLSQGQQLDAWVRSLNAIAASGDLPAQLRLEAIAAVPPEHRKIDQQTLRLLIEQLSLEHIAKARSLAIDILAVAELDTEQLVAVTAAIPGTGAMELKRLMEMIATSKSESVGMAAIEALDRCPVTSALSLPELEKQLAGFGRVVAEHAQPLLADLRRQQAAKLTRLEEILELTKQGDVRRGQRVFHSREAVCITCHGMGYLGGVVGPDLTRIGQVRTERDLLESILFPSASFVRSYEPTLILTTEGKLYNGVIRDETSSEVVLQIDAEKQVRLAHDAIEERQAGTVSIMPEGLDKHFTPQQLADLVVFLKASQ